MKFRHRASRDNTFLTILSTFKPAHVCIFNYVTYIFGAPIQSSTISLAVHMPAALTRIRTHNPRKGWDSQSAVLPARPRISRYLIMYSDVIYV